MRSPKSSGPGPCASRPRAGRHHSPPQSCGIRVPGQPDSNVYIPAETRSSRPSPVKSTIRDKPTRPPIRRGSGALYLSRSPTPINGTRSLVEATRRVQLVRKLTVYWTCLGLVINHRTLPESPWRKPGPSEWATSCPVTRLTTRIESGSSTPSSPWRRASRAKSTRGSAGRFDFTNRLSTVTSSRPVDLWDTRAARSRPLAWQIFVWPSAESIFGSVASTNTPVFDTTINSNATKTRITSPQARTRPPSLPTPAPTFNSGAVTAYSSPALVLVTSP